MKNFKMQKSITTRVNEINKMLPKIQALDSIVSTYDGGTFPYYIILTKEIEIKNQFVYIHEQKDRYSYNFEKRYNTNTKNNPFAYGGYNDLMYALNLIRKEFKKALK